MKNLEEYEKELKTCSKCGLCQSVCPIYKETGIETVVSRGKFNMLLGLIKGDLKYSQNIDKYLSLCLNCKACDDFCPSSIKASEIITAAKNKYKKYCYPIKYDSFFKLKMLSLSFVFNLYRFSHFSFLVGKFEKYIIKVGFLGKLFILFDKISRITVKRKPTIKNKEKNLKVIYFEGCFTKYLNPSVKNALLNQLEKNNIEVILKNFECCGISALYSGKKDLFLKLKEKNTKLLNEECDYIVCDCATCLSAIKEYNESFSNKVIDVFELLSKTNSTQIQKEKITYHLPCHLRENKKEIKNEIEKTFSNYVEMKDFDSCCGFAGDFSINFPEISEKISDKKIQNIEKTDSNYILTSCPGCVIGLNKGLINKNLNKKVLNIVEYLEINS